MSDYDFKTLNDKEFEILCTDLLSRVFSKKFERFKRGRDSGVDGRYFIDDSNEVILQCKHWANTPVAQLISRLRIEERPKLDKLNPARYLLTVSLPLSRKDKKDIALALGTHLKSQSDIYGNEDLNDILKAAPDIEQRHYKLWLHSSSVLSHILNNAILGRSSFTLEEIREASCRYVVTSNHQTALKQLEELNVVIVTGEPGIGKSTLAEHLCIHYVAQDYAFLKISKDISEAEGVFNQDTKQIFYFDDFLGSNYLEALSGHEGNEITQFIRRISKNKNKRFVLTSRSTILNQGKLLIGSFQQNNLEKKEYELKIESLSEMDRAKILYNHIWHSQLQPSYIDELYKDHRYRTVISHKNFNPRLISYITDATRLDSNSPSTYWAYIEKALANPSEIWENPFVAQQDDFGRALIILVVLHGHRVEEAQLAEAYHEYLSLPDNQVLKGRSDFHTNIRTLTGSFFNRYLEVGKAPSINLFNPSISDYVLPRVVQNRALLKNAFMCLRTLYSLITLRSLIRNKVIALQDSRIIIVAILNHIIEVNFTQTSPSYAADVFAIYLKNYYAEDAERAVLQQIARFVLSEKNVFVTSEAYLVAKWAVQTKSLDVNEMLKFAHENMLRDVQSDEAISDFWSLLTEIPNNTVGHGKVVEDFNAYLVDYISENLSEFVEPTDAFSSLNGGEYVEAEEKILNLVTEKLNALGLSFTPDADAIFQSYDVHYNMDKYFNDLYEEGDGGHNSHAGDFSISEIDDLFDRS